MKLSLRYIIYFRMSFCITLAVVTYLATTELEFTAVSSSYDKLNHIAAFIVLALLLDFSFPNSRFNTDKFLPLIAYGVGIEVIQHYLPHRMFSFFDVGADILGLVGYGLLIPFLRRIPLFEDRWIK
jgi:VanZ family protein